MHALIASGQNVHGLIVGGTHSNKKQYEEELKEQVAKLNLQSNITFAGHRNDVKEIMAISTIVCSLSTTPESFGRTTLEALSIGKPVIGYSHGGVQEQLEHMFPDGLIPVGAIDIAREKLITWLAAAPHPPSKHPFSLDNMCNKTVQLYQES